jgi:hypothetical protein
MISLRTLAVAGVAICAACVDEPTHPALGAVADTGSAIGAFVSVDNPNAAVGQTVLVTVGLQGSSTQVGAYNARLHFDPTQLALSAEVPVTHDGLRVSNPKGAATGEIRFAGANAAGFATPTLYSATFVVRSAGFASSLNLEIDELTAAKTLGDLTPRVKVAQVNGAGSR